MAEKVREWGILYLLYNADRFQVVSGFRSKMQAIRWAKANNLKERADEWEVFRVAPKGSGRKGMGSFIGPFSEWYNENLESLQDDYYEYRNEMKSEGRRPLSFKAYAKERWKWLKEKEG